MKTIAQLEFWFEHNMPQLLDALKSDALPQWGSMNVTQMMDHLRDAFKLSMAEYAIPEDAISEKAEKFKMISLLSDRPLPKGFNNPILQLLFKTSEPEFEQAKLELVNQYGAFKLYFESNAGVQTPHNMFGPLHYHEWLWFHYKHCLHHFAQFGLMPYQERIELE